METLKASFHRAAWTKDYVVRTHAMWDFKRYGADHNKAHLNAEREANSMKYHPDYPAAKKQGDFHAGQEVVKSLLSDEALFKLEDDLRGKKPLIIVPSLTEYDSKNVIPSVFANVLAMELGLDVCDYIYERKGQGRTGQGALYRLIRQPVFRSDTLPVGQDFLVADDVCTLGGTLANLVQFIEKNGANVIASTILADGDSSPQAKQRRQTRDFQLNASVAEGKKVAKLYGNTIEQSLRKYAGISYESLTSREAFFLCNATSPKRLEADLFRMENEGLQQARPKSRRGQLHTP